MSLLAYPEYKDSGFDWLEQIPKHWGVAPLWVLFKRKKITGHPTEKLLSVYRDYGIVPKESRSDNNNKPSDDLSSYQLVNDGDLVINKMKAWQGSVAISEYYGIVSPAYFVFNPKHENNKYYINYLIRSIPYITFYLSISKGIRPNQWDLDPQYHSRMPILLPPKAEQDAIAEFLDRETGKIDALIAEQEKLLDLLAEKREATISRAVTRGLNPNAPMKDSGIAWLGEVPAHWSIYPLKRETAFITSGPRGWAEYYSDTGPLFIRIGNLTRDSVSLDLADIQRVTTPTGKEGQRTHVCPGDVLFSITAHLGAVAVIPEGFENAFVSQHIALVRLKIQNILPHMIAYIALSVIGKNHFSMQAYGGTKVQLSLDDILDMPILLPPISEQEEIISFLEGVKTNFDKLDADIHIAITALKERRSALIAAAVTGKIDVRGAMAENQAA